MAEEENVRRSMNPRLNLEAVLCRMAYLEPLIPIEAVLARMEGLERRLAGGAAADRRSGRQAPDGKPERPDGSGSRRAGRTDRCGTVGPMPGGRPGRPPAGHGGTSPSAEALQPATDSVAGGRVAESRRARGRRRPPEGAGTEFKDFVKRQDAALCAKIESGKLPRLRGGASPDRLCEGVSLPRRRGRGEGGDRAARRPVLRAGDGLEIETLAPEDGRRRRPNGNGNGTAGRRRTTGIQEIRREALSHPLVLKSSMSFPARRCGT